MEKELIKDALLNAFSLLNSEIESVALDDLLEKYRIVIVKVENALKELNGNG